MKVNLIEYKMYAYKDKNFLILRKCFNFVKAGFSEMTKKNNTVVFSFLFPQIFLVFDYNIYKILSHIV